ncbi:hypoxanthine phosphoribosyltransferase [Candidatus Riesia pthiripubis]|uniref:Hypoxanthine phosphoribosyltransferase n=1 Tax=Candidatus Riesia pthiripubis TaxID=428412 RepID=A0A1V0HPA7_9ENTR|nr:hypoxanthine phosphoribosyltransferase [Candidatus Riesia pthiripubis]
MRKTIKILISKKDIQKRVKEMAKEIVKHYKNLSNELILVGILNGSFIFIADLCREINVPHSIDFMRVSSYGNKTIQNKKVKIIQDLNRNIYNKHILIVEDIIDSGNTLKRILQILKSRNPKSITVCTFLDKPSRRKSKVFVKWIGYSINDKFVVGYGIDYAQKYRHLPYIGYIL